jgi:hypothetical protein
LVSRLDLDAVVPVGEQPGRPVVRKEEPVAAGLARAVLSGARGVHACEPLARDQPFREVDRRMPGPGDGRSAKDPPADPAGRHGQARPGGESRKGRQVERLADEVSRSCDRVRVELSPRLRAVEGDLRDPRRRRVGPGRQSAGPQGIDVPSRDTLGEVHVPPGRGDVSEQSVQRNLLMVGNGRDDVPVAERSRVGAEDADRLGAFQVHFPGRYRVHGSAVRDGDVDPEVEGARAAGDPRVVEGAADRVGPVERRHGPAVRRGGHRYESTPAVRRQGDGSRRAFAPCRARRVFPSGPPRPDG